MKQLIVVTLLCRINVFFKYHSTSAQEKDDCNTCFRENLYRNVVVSLFLNRICSLGQLAMSCHMQNQLFY